MLMKIKKLLFIATCLVFPLLASSDETLNFDCSETQTAFVGYGWPKEAYDLTGRLKANMEKKDDFSPSLSIGAKEKTQIIAASKNHGYDGVNFRSEECFLVYALRPLRENVVACRATSGLRMIWFNQKYQNGVITEAFSASDMQTPSGISRFHCKKAVAD